MPGLFTLKSFLTQSLLNTPDADPFEGNMVPGAPMDDAPVQVAGRDAWLLDQVGHGFACLLFADAMPSADARAQQAQVARPRATRARGPLRTT